MVRMFLHISCVDLLLAVEHLKARTKPEHWLIDAMLDAPLFDLQQLSRV